MIDKATDFILSKINLYVGDRSEKVHVDVEYEIPMQAIKEAVVNAVCHRDYTSNASVQVMLFADRFEVDNPGSLPHGLTVEELYTAHKSIPANPLIAEAMYLYGTIERMGTGTEEMTKLCVEKGIGKPEFIPGSGFLTVIRRNTGSNITENITEKLTKNQIIIINEINKNPYITSEEISNIIGIDAVNVRVNLAKLKAKGFIKRVGPDKGGHWKVNEK